MSEELNFGNNMEVTSSKNNCTVFQMRNSNGGNGVMTSYNVLDGIRFIYNDIHMSSFKSEFVTKTRLFCIDHCREGRIEQEVKPGVYRYTEAGDLRIDNRFNHNTSFFFPLSHYHGITIAFEVDKADRAIKKIFPDFPVSIDALSKKYCNNNYYYLRGETAIEHIFSELYNVPNNIKEYYFKIKIFELLLFLSELVIGKNENDRPYFYKSQTEKVKAVHSLITTDIQTHYTLDELSKRFDISLTGMKKCFKAIYGDSVYSYIRKYRMNKAATLLRTTDLTVAVVANEVGYDSPSKFSAAFKKKMNLLPLEYRKARLKE